MTLVPREPGIDRPGDSDPPSELSRFMAAKHLPHSELSAQPYHIASPRDGLSVPGAFGLIPGGEGDRPLSEEGQIVL